MKRVDLPKGIFIASALSFVCAFSSCQHPAGLGAMTGAGIGALGGAVYSEHKDDEIKKEKVIAGSAIGAIAGAVGGALADYQAKKYTPRYSNQGDYYNNPYSSNNPYAQRNPNYQQNYPPRRQVPNYKAGIPTSTRGIVRSPHPPHSNIDVSGFRRGSLVQDENGKPFIVP